LSARGLGLLDAEVELGDVGGLARAALAEADRGLEHERHLVAFARCRFRQWAIWGDSASVRWIVDPTSST
jgi:hypothetical protein